jgi:hypothetical protein
MIVAPDDLDYEVRDVMLNIWHSIVQLKKVSSKAFVIKKNMFNFTRQVIYLVLFFTLFTTIVEKDRMVLGVGHLNYGCELQSNHKI